MADSDVELCEVVAWLHLTIHNEMASLTYI